LNWIKILVRRSLGQFFLLIVTTGFREQERDVSISNSPEQRSLEVTGDHWNLCAAGCPVLWPQGTGLLVRQARKDPL